MYSSPWALSCFIVFTNGIVVNIIWLFCREKQQDVYVWAAELEKTAHNSCMCSSVVMSIWKGGKEKVCIKDIWKIPKWNRKKFPCSSEINMELFGHQKDVWCTLHIKHTTSCVGLLGIRPWMALKMGVKGIQQNRLSTNYRLGMFWSDRIRATISIH